MRFCPRCESRLVLLTEKGKPFFSCEKCGYREVAGGEEMLERKEFESVVVIDREKDVKAMSKIVAPCPKCDNRIAFWWTVQTNVDRDPTQFFRCTRCSHTWRVD